MSCSMKTVAAGSHQNVMAGFRAVVPFALLLSLSACKLIDQHTFDPSPEEEPLPVAAAPIKTDARAPLIAIDYATPSPNYRDLLRVAVRAAESRSRQVQYDVVAAVPKLLPGAPPQALEVMRAIAAEGVPAARIHLGLRAEPGLSATQVRIYVR